MPGDNGPYLAWFSRRMATTKVVIVAGGVGTALILKGIVSFIHRDQPDDESIALKLARWAVSVTAMIVAVIWSSAR